MEKTNSFKDLIAWQKAHLFVLSIYKVSKSFPNDELYALTSQIRRAAVSVAANIAEGYKKKTLPNKINFLNISEGSLEEIKYYIILANDLEYISTHSHDLLMKEAEEVGKLISGYDKFLQKQKTKKSYKPYS
jgi:four helix bundle protein